MGPLRGAPPSSLSEALTLRADTDTASPIGVRLRYAPKSRSNTKPLRSKPNEA